MLKIEASFVANAAAYGAVRDGQWIGTLREPMETVARTSDVREKRAWSRRIEWASSDDLKRRVWTRNR